MWCLRGDFREPWEMVRGDMWTGQWSVGTSSSRRHQTKLRSGELRGNWGTLWLPSPLHSWEELAPGKLVWELNKSEYNSIRPIQGRLMEDLRQSGSGLYFIFTLNVVLRIWIMGAVMRPQEKNWRKTATTAWQTEAFLMLQAAIVLWAWLWSIVEIK